MAGGSGERFWPLSTKDKPKQLIPITSSRSMIRDTVDRVKKIVDLNDIYIATNETLLSAIIKELGDINRSNIIIEPQYKDTAAAIAYGATVIAHNCGNPIIVVLASDHLIRDVDNFIDMINIAEKAASNGGIVTLGIRPTRAETEYGYIKVDNISLGKPTKAIRFMEKPNYLTAQQYLDEGNYVWNSGMFIFSYNTLMDEIANCIPNHFQIITELKSAIKDETGLNLLELSRPYFCRFEKISFDFAVMEKSDNILCIPVDFGWSDVGGYNSLIEIFDNDTFGNVVNNCTYVSIDSKDNIVISDKKERLIASIGIENCIIVDTHEALFICARSDTHKIRELLKKIY
jgi:mannose-1-phosphate guanylyltransferase